MGETIRIEIPVSVNDNTDPGLSNITSKMEKLSNAAQKVSRIMASGFKTRGVEQAAERVERTLGQEHSIEVSADDNATPVLSQVEDAAERVNGITADVEIGADDNASPEISGVEDAAATLDGTSADVELGADDNATGVVNDVGDSLSVLNGNEAVVELTADDNATMQIMDVEDALAALNGEVAVASVEADDTATQIIRDAEDAVATFDGASVTAELGAEDNATPVIDDVIDKAATWDGSVFTATMSVVNAVTSPIGAVASAVKNPIAQGATFLGVSAGLADTVNTYKNFESMMSQVQAISGATGKEFDDLTAKAQEMGATTKFTATESAEAMNYMAMAGWKPQQMMNGISGIMNLAAASGEDLGTTSDIVTDALTAFGLKAEDAGHFSDVLAQASASSNTNVGMLGESFKHVAPVAGAMNYSVEDTSLALGLMANSSIKGSMAGTALKTSLANMAAPTDSMAAAMEKYGISLTDSSGNMKTLKGVMDNLRSSLGGLSETEQTAAASTIFGKEAMSGMLAIINASEDDYNNLSNAIGNADGAAQDMADTMLDNLEGSMTLMQSAVEGVQNSFGQRLTPYIRGFVDSITDAMPAVTTALDNLMDNVDKKAAHMKTVVGTMTASDEWQNADLFGKVDIAWDTLIAEPFMDWASGEGAQIMSTGLGTLFSNAAAILPGGQKAGISSILSAMLLAKGATSMITNARNIGTALAPIGNGLRSIVSVAQESSSVGSFISTLGSMVPTAAKVSLAAAGVAAAVAGIKLAVDAYNETQLDNNLEEHFGNISLSTSEIEGLAGKVIPVDITAQLNVANVAFNEAAELVTKAEDILEENDTITWRVLNVEGTLPEDDAQTLLTNTDSFVANVTKAIEKEEYAATLSVKTTLGENSNSDAIVSQMHEWFAEDSAAAESLGTAVTDMLQKAIDEGTYNVDTATAISILEGKMLDLVNGAQNAELQGKLKFLEMTSGGAALDSDSWASFVDQVGEYQAELTDTTKENYMNLFGTLEQLAYNNESRRDTVNSIEEVLKSAYDNLNVSSALSGWESMFSSLGQAYEKELNTSGENMEQSTTEWVNRLQKGLSDMFDTTGEGWENVFNGLMATDVSSGLDKATKDALSDRFSHMLPTVEELRSSIDSYYGENGEQLSAIPESLMNAYYQAMEVGAAGGDEGATAALVARKIADSFGDKSAFENALNQAGLTTDYLANFFGGTLMEEVNRAFGETTDQVDYSAMLDGIIDSLSGEEPDWTAVESLLNQYGYSISGALKEQGIDVDGDVPIKTDGLTVDTDSLARGLEGLNYVGTTTLDGGEVAFQYTVNKGETLSGIMEQYGVAWNDVKEQIQQANPDIDNLDLIYPDQVINIPKAIVEATNVDTSQVNDTVQSAIEQAISALDAEGAEMSVTAEGVKVDLANVEVDSDTAAAQIEAALGMESGTLAANGIEVQAGASVTVPSELVTVDTSGIQSATEQAADETETEPIEKDASANVNVTDATTDTSGMQAQAEEDAKGAVGDMPVEGSANVTFSGTTTDTSGVVEQVTTDLESALTDVPANGHANITLDHPGSEAEVERIYTEVSSEVESKFSGTIPATANVAVTLNWHITNPSASISTSSSGSSVSATIAGHASGGEVGLNGAELSWVGEEGLEYIIPTVPSRRQRGIELWESAGRTLGVLGPDNQISAHANGGTVGREVSNTIPYSDTDTDSSGSEKTEKEAVPTNVVSDKSGVVVQVNLSPQFNISDTNENDVIRLIKAHIKELADDLGSEIATMLSETYENTPITS